jgi:hypothetical protein
MNELKMWAQAQINKITTTKIKAFTHENKNSTMRHTPFSLYYNMIKAHRSTTRFTMPL